MRTYRPQDAGAPLALLLSREIRAWLESHTLNHNFVRRPGTSRFGGGAHDDFGILDSVDDAAKDSVLLVERRLLFQRDEPLAVGAVDVIRARRAQRPSLIWNVAELSGHIRIR